MKQILYSTALFFVALSFTHAAAPSGLMTDLLEHTDRVWLDGYPSTVQLHELGQTIERFQTATIFNKKPSFTWIVNDDRQNVKQTAYRILVGTDRAKLEKDEADLWDSGKVDSDTSVAVPYDGKQSAGKPLPPKTVVYWKVKTWNNGDEQPFSNIKAFLTADELVDYKTAVYPLQKVDQEAETFKHYENFVFVDYAKAAFGRLRLNIESEKDAQIVMVHFGEAIKDGRIDRNPGGTIRYAAYPLRLMKGTHSYTIKFRPDKRNTGGAAIKMPEYIGEVLPFRYVEVEYENGVQVKNGIREMVYYPFDETASDFKSDNDILNQVWELCKYSIPATSFCGVYVDGDRERIPYEADALINQLCHYGVDREYSLARHSHEYLIRHATWPTEWILTSVLMAYYDYLYTGDARSAEVFYADLQAKLLLPLADPETGLISTKTGKQTPELMKAIHYYRGKEIRDVIDWPHTGILGLGKSEGGETDGFIFTDYNAVVNAYHFEALGQMSRIATILGKTEDAEKYAELAARVKKSYNEKLFDAANGRYRDGIGTDHAALHSNMFPLAFGMVPEANRKSVMDYIRSRGMACSVYGSQALMDAVYGAEDAEYGLKLMSSDAERSWYNMIRVGSTISLEAWDNKYKPNQDWNHAWGAVPANAIPRHLLGVQPLEPGFRRVRIQPRISSLKTVFSVVPTIRGPITMNIDDKKLEVTIPANMEAEVILPGGKTQTVGSGRHSLVF